MESAIGQPSATRRARAPRAARGEPELADRPPDARHPALHRLRDDAVRGVLRLLLLPPRRRQRRAPGRPRASSCRSRSPASTRRSSISSSFTDALGARGDPQRATAAAMQMGLAIDLPARRDLPLHPDQRVRPHRLQRPRRRLRLDLLRPHRPARRPRLRRPDCCSPSPTSAPGAATSAPRRRTTWASRCPGIYWHFVDVMWIIVFTTVYIL